MKYAACRYCIRSGIDEVFCELLLCYICGCVGDALRCAMSGVFHHPFLLSLGTWMNIFPFHLIVIPFPFKTAVNLKSQSLSIEKIEMCVRLDMMWP